MCGGGGSTQVSTTNVEPWAEQKGYLTGGFEQAKNIYNRGAPAYYPGETIAGFDPAQTMAQESTLNYATGPRTAGMQAGGEGALMRSLGGYTGFNAGQSADLLAGNVRTGAGTPFGAMTDAFTSDVMGNLQKNILPGIRQNQVQYQPGGSSRNQLVSERAIENAVQAGLTKPTAQMYNQAYQQAQGMRMPFAQMGIQQQQFGQGQYPTTMNAPLGLFNAMDRVGAQRQGMAQRAIDADMARYEYEANAPQNALRNYMAMISGDYGSTTTSTVPQQGNDFLGTVGQVAGIAGSLGFAPFSDERLKDNVTYIGKSGKHNVYSWEWNDKAKELGINTPTIGVMAQEVMEINPDAVSMNDNGYLQVNYGAL